MPSHFSFGLMDSPGDVGALTSMRSTNGTAWDYRYQYLSGGVNNSSEWSTWNSPPGAFAANYISESTKNGVTPAFVYYMMYQSNGPSGGSESGTDLAHLANATTMNAYYNDWALLMHQIGAASQTHTLVIVEPDLWGFIEQAAASKGSNSAASIPASVASSGNAEAAGLPDTAQGFAEALLQIRDRYAPNAVLALHASEWGTGQDVGTNTDPNLNASAIGTQTAQFLQTAGLSGVPAGMSTFDLLSVDIADHDSGQSGTWWDPTNTTFPNFSREASYLSALTAGANRRAVMWQVPVGNQVYDTENNSTGHTQDNKAQYLTSHVADFANAGVVGVLFGPGNGGTNATDVRGDGVTNPAPISTYQCNLCNTKTSTYPDDDGGFLRLTLGTYYRNGAYPLPGGVTPPPTPTSTASPSPTTTASPSPTSGTCASPTIAFGAGSASPATVAPGATVKLSTTFTASCATTGLVDFEVYNTAGQKVYQTALSNQSLTGQSQTFTANWAVPSGQAAGSYTLKIGVFGPNWSPLYGWNSNAATFNVQAAAATCAGAPSISFGSGSVSPSAPAHGTTATLKAALTASCATTGLVDFEVYNTAGQKVYQTWQDNVPLTGSAQTFTATWAIPSSQATGTYTLKMGVFAPGWSAFWAWDDNAATFSVN